MHHVRVDAHAIELLELPAIRERLAGMASFEGGAALARALDEIGYDSLAAQRGRLVDGRYHGIGIGCFVDSTGPGPAEYARIRVRSPDAIDVFTGCSSSGQGHQTTFAQIAADVLGLPIVTSDESEASAKGAALLAGVGAGTFVDAHAAARASFRPAARFEPRIDAHAMYERLYMEWGEDLRAAS